MSLVRGTYLYTHLYYILYVASPGMRSTSLATQQNLELEFFMPGSSRKANSCAPPPRLSREESQGSIRRFGRGLRPSLGIRFHPGFHLHSCATYTSTPHPHFTLSRDAPSPFKYASPTRLPLLQPPPPQSPTRLLNMALPRPALHIMRQLKFVVPGALATYYFDTHTELLVLALGGAGLARCVYTYLV